MRRSARLPCARCAGFLTALALGAAGSVRDARASPHPALHLAPAVGRPAAAIGSIGSRFGVGPADSLLASPSRGDHLRAVERLAKLATPSAIAELLEAVSPGGVAADDPRARVEALRGLVPFAARARVREFMFQELTHEGEGTATRDWERDTAAMALAASREPHALELLATAVRRGGRSGPSAEQALLAYPPSALEPLLGKEEALDASLCDLLGRLGDLRALVPLRRTLVLASLDSSPSGVARAAAAARALARLGDPEPMALARQWLAPGHVPSLRLAGAEVLALLGSREPIRFAAELLPRIDPSPDDLDAILSLGWHSGDPDFVRALSAELEQTSDHRLRSRLMIALAHADTERAVEKLGDALSRADSEVASEAAFALAQAESEQASTVLARALSDARADAHLRALAARAAVVRVLLGRMTRRPVIAALHRMVDSADPTERAAAGFGLVALRDEGFRAMLESTDPVVVRAAARAAPLAGDAALTACADRFAREQDNSIRLALAIAWFVDPQYADRVSTSDLLRTADRGGPIAPLAAIALGPRDGEYVGPSLEIWLTRGEMVMRVAVAEALARSPLPSAAARLASAYRYEPDVRVRRALLRALATRDEPERVPALALAARLDPDAEARAIAARAISQNPPSDATTANPRALLVSGPHRPLAGPAAFAWCQVAMPKGLRTPGRLVLGDGGVVPVVPDPDGLIVTGGFAPGAYSFEPAFDLAFVTSRDEASSHGATFEAAEPAH